MHGFAPVLTRCYTNRPGLRATRIFLRRWIVFLERDAIGHQKTGQRMMLLKNKVAVIYGAGGAIGSAVARAFGREGARLFLTGRLQAPVEALAKDIVSAGGSAGAAAVDALDELAVDKHLQSVIDKA